MLLLYADEMFGCGNVGMKIEKGNRRLILFVVSRRCGVEMSTVEKEGKLRLLCQK
jgi:hypothetical protein